MRSVTFSMGVSLDGYIVGPDGDLEWTQPDEEVFRSHIDEIRGVGAYTLGRRLYGTMLYWETADQDPSLDASRLEWAALWKALPKVVFSTTLSAVQGNARLASGGLADEIERLRAEPGESDIAIGGATLAAEAAALDLIDEYRVRVYPVLVGGGTLFFPQRQRRVNGSDAKHGLDILAKRLDATQWQTDGSQLPVRHQFVDMDRRPLHGETQSSRRQGAVHQPKALDRDLRLVVAVDGVEVRRLVVVELHANDIPKNRESSGISPRYEPALIRDSTPLEVTRIRRVAAPSASDPSRPQTAFDKDRKSRTAPILLESPAWRSIQRT